MNKWMAHLKATMKKHPKLSLGEAMKVAKKTYKKGGASEPKVGGYLVKVGGAGCMPGGRRRRHTKKHRGGQLFGFGELGGTVSDGNGRMTPVGSVADVAQGGNTTVALAEPVRAAQLKPASGGRRHRRKTRKHRKY